MAKKYITNTGDIVDWDDIIVSLANARGDVRGFETPYENETSNTNSWLDSARTMPTG